MISVVVVDDEQLVRSGFAALLASDPDVRGGRDGGRRGHSSGSHQARASRCRSHGHPDAGSRRGQRNCRRHRGSSAQRNTRGGGIVLTTFDLDEYVHAALRAGASGFLLKDAQPTDLLAAVHLVDQGESVLAPALVRRLIATYVQTPTTAPKPAWLDSLTPREIEVLVAVARGLSNAEIGDALYMSAATAKTHVGRLLTKLNARDRTHLVIAAYEAGLINRT